MNTANEPIVSVERPLGANPKLDDLMVLVAVAAANESGNGFDHGALKRHAKRATELWNTRPSQLPVMDVERIARAIEPSVWAKFDARVRTWPDDEKAAELAMKMANPKTLIGNSVQCAHRAIAAMHST